MEESGASAFSGIDLIIFINLNHRTDRREETENELKRVGAPAGKILRWEAINDPDNGAVACAKSHSLALEFVLNERKDVNVLLMLEDDFNFADDVNLVHRSLREFLNYPRDMWEMAFLSAEVRKREDYNELVSLDLFSQTSAGYLVNRSILPRLISNIKEGHDKLKETGKCFYFLDVYWWHLMRETRKIFYFNKALGYQRRSYSDIWKYVPDRHRENVVQNDGPALSMFTDGQL